MNGGNQELPDEARRSESEQNPRGLMVGDNAFSCSAALGHPDHSASGAIVNQNGAEEAGGYHFKRFPSEENREESQQKGANKVECKKWSAKGTYRKASADREPTQDVNTLGAYGHVRI